MTRAAGLRLKHELIYKICIISGNCDRLTLTGTRDQSLETSRAITGRRTTYAGASDVMSLLLGARGNVIALPGGAGNKLGKQGSAGTRGGLIDGCPNRLAFEPIASELRMLLENGKPDDLFVPTRNVRGRRDPAEVPYRHGGRMGVRFVTQPVERCPVLAGCSLASDAPTDRGTNSSGPCRAMLFRDRAGGHKSMSSYG
jgi:hypothetical protein